MKIYFDNVNWQSASGPNSFAKRLAEQLSYFGHTIADASDYDVAIVFIEESGRLNPAKPKVLRLDGIWFKEQEFASGANDKIKAAYDSANHVVFQSDFDKNMVTHHWGEPSSSSVIRNGIQLKKLDEGTNATLVELRQRYSKVYVCSANWHRQKRLKENIHLFMHLRATVDPYSCLVVMGSNPDCLVADANIYYTDVLPHEACLEVFRAADWCIHLAWADHSPNVVCEAISQGCPVICAETGGTKELVGASGIVLKETHEYKYELFDYDNPPPLDVTQVKSLPKTIVDTSSVDIWRVAREYETTFQQLVGK